MSNELKIKLQTAKLLFHFMTFPRFIYTYESNKVLFVNNYGSMQNNTNISALQPRLFYAVSYIAE